MQDDNASTAPTSDPIAPTLAPPRWWDGALLPALVSVGAIVAAALALRGLSWESVPVTLVTVVSVLALGFAATSWTLRGSQDGRRIRVAALALLGFVPLLAVEARRALGEPLPAGSETEATFAAIALAVPSFTAVGALAWHAAATPSSELQRFVRNLCMLAIGNCATLVVIGWFALPRDAMPRVAELEPLPAGEHGFLEQRAEQPENAPFALGRSCIGRSCFAYVRSGAATRSIGPRFARDARLTLLAADADHLVLSADGRAIAVAPVVLDADTLGSAPDAAFAARNGLPVSFLALAGLGLAIALLGGFHRRRLTRRLATLAAAQQAWVLDNGWLALESGAYHRSLPGMSPGPWLLEEPPQSHAYRGATEDEAPRAHHGNRTDLVRSLSHARTSVDALIVGWIVPLTTPLLVALAFASWG